MLFRIVLGLLIILAGYIVYSVASLSMRYEQLIDVAESRIIGPQSGDHIDVVLFFDYTAPNTQTLDSAVRSAVTADGASYYIPYPVFREGNAASQDYALHFYLAERQGQSLPMHDALLVRAGEPLDSDAASAALFEEAGIDITKAAENGPATDAVIASYDLFKSIGGRQLPTLIINRKIFYAPAPGDTITADLIQKLIEKARNEAQ